MNAALFRPTDESEARLLILIDTFTTPTTSLEGRTKLAKLDFLLRYPDRFRLALQRRAPSEEWPEEISADPTIEGRMVRYRYGPWDPSYFALLGRLVGRGLITAVPGSRTISYRTTDEGRAVARGLRATPAWQDTAKLTTLLKRHFNLTGTNLKTLIYENFPDIAGASWGKLL